jgi:prepilin-type N-terminal cleavage/methylation domain-containing protein
MFPAFSLLELLVVIAIIGIVAALLFPLFARSKATARNAVCTSQLRQLGIATRLYAEENNSRLPIAERLPSHPMSAGRTLPRIFDVLSTFVAKNTNTNSSSLLFRCPSDNDEFFEVEGSSYMWNVSLNGQEIDLGEKLRVIISGNTTNFVSFTLKTNITDTAISTPLLFDYDDFHPRPPKSGKNAVYMDGHAAPLEPPVSLGQ